MTRMVVNMAWVRILAAIMGSWRRRIVVMEK
jgi:hypothetical protein